MALICNLATLWLVALLNAQRANVAETLSQVLDIPFPPASPTDENLDDICCQAHGRPRYPDSFYPRSGRSYLRRRGKAINRLESWYAFCCSDPLAKDNDFWVSCCVKQAWEQAMSKFCTDEFSVKTRAHFCCNSSGSTRRACFDNLPSPGYSAKPGYTAPQMPHESGFNFNTSACAPGGKGRFAKN